MPPLPFSPVGFSGLIERDLGARQSRKISEVQSETRKPLRHTVVLVVALRAYLMPVVLINSMMRFWKMTNMTIVGVATTVEAAIT